MTGRDAGLGSGGAARPLDKSPDAFRTISEVADELDLPQHVLRFWETRFVHIKPLKRGGGRRYYRRDDVDLLRGIRHLLYGEGYTIKGVQRILKEEGVRAVQAFGRGETLAPPPPPAMEDGLPEADDIDRDDATALSGVHDAAGLAALRLALAELEECARVLQAARADLDGDPS